MYIWFADVCIRGGLKVNAGKSKIMVMSGEGGLDLFGICLRIQIFGMCLDESGTGGVEYSRKGGKWEKGGRCH